MMFAFKTANPPEIVGFFAFVMIALYPCISAARAYSRGEGGWAVLRALTFVELAYR